MVNNNKNLEKRIMKKMEIKSHTFNHLGGALSGTKWYAYLNFMFLPLIKSII